MTNSQEFTILQNDISHLYSMHLATIRTEYKIISLAHHTHSRRLLLLLHAGSKLHSGDCFCVPCICIFIVFLDLLLCVFHNSASGLQICYNKVELS